MDDLSVIVSARHSLAELKAHVHIRKGEDEQAQKNIRQGFNKAWRNLENAFDQARGEWA